MRRKDREQNSEFALSVIDQALFGTLSLVDPEGLPYAVPLSLVRKDQYLYFHAAREGRKNELIGNSRACTVAFSINVKIPDLYSYDEQRQVLEGGSSVAGLITSKIFTCDYESAIVRGVVEPVRGEAEQALALRLICEKFTPDKMHLFQLALTSGLPRTAIFRVRIEEITGKAKKTVKTAVKN